MNEDTVKNSSTENGLALSRKRSADDEMRRQKRGYHGAVSSGSSNAIKADIMRSLSKHGTEMESEEKEEKLFDFSSVSDVYLTSLPTSLLSHVGSFLVADDMTAMAMTNKMMYNSRSEYKKAHIFETIREETLPIEHDFKSVMEPFRFLFRSTKYGIIQVDFSLANPPKGGYAAGLPRLRNSYARVKKKAPWEKIAFRINVQKKFEKEGSDTSSARTTPKVIFRLDQSMPGCCFHFESKLVVGWDAGKFAYLMQICATRMVELQIQRGDTCDDGLVLVRPSVDNILTKFQATIRDNVLRGVKNHAKDKEEKK